MKILDYTLTISEYSDALSYFKHFYPTAKLLFFDIETTGFIAKNTTLYLIGTLWYDNENIYIRQWFNDDGYSEKKIIDTFCDFCKDYTLLVHFNGNGFDLPYLKQKSDVYHIPFHLETSLYQIDIYQEIKQYKNVFALENMKQTTLERFLDIQRDDKFSGKELIQIYQQYIGNPCTEKEEILLLHNHDDLLGMPQISQILYYQAFFENITITSVTSTETENVLQLQFDFDTIKLPKRIVCSKNNIYINALGQSAILEIPIQKGSLKHYFSDYKNYYYLPKEDMAIHKSVATYVEHQNKQKATKETCYIQKNDSYILCVDPAYPEQFKTHHKDKTSYQSIASFYNSTLEEQIQYIKKILRTFR